MKSISRRKFMGHATVAGGVLTLAAKQIQMIKKNIFIHHVYFWLNNPESADDVKKLIAGLQKLSAVKTIRDFHIGKPADTNRDVIDRSYSISWMVIFDNKEDQDSYQKDAIHLKFVEECSALWKKVVVYDSVDA